MLQTTGKAVFLSYAHEDAMVAQRLAEALRGAGIEVWFDQSELVGGDAWDQKIRRQIRDCALFVPVISANTQARLEGYFRIEWKLGAQRTHAMADEKAFLLPVVIDETRDGDARVPPEFRAVQWTRLLGGEMSSGFADQVRNLLSGDQAAKPSSLAVSSPASPALGTNRARTTDRSSDGHRGESPERSVAVLALLIGNWIFRGIGSD